MYKKKHSNFIWASLLVFVTGGLGLIKYFYFTNSMINAETMALAAFNLTFFIGLGFLVNKPYIWVKYLMLVLVIIGLINIHTMFGALIQSPNIISFTVILQRILLSTATILLFILQKNEGVKVV